MIRMPPRTKPLAFILALFLVGASAPERNSPVQLIRVGSFHGHEVNARSGETWWGLFPVDSGFELRSLRVDVKPTRDMSDEGNTRTGKEVSVKEGTPLVLMRGIKGMKAGPVTTVIGSPRFFYPGERISQEISKGKYFSLSAYGNVDRPPDSGPGDTRITAYRLVLCVQPWIESNQQELVDSFYGPMPRVVWAGDLDGDGRLDLLADFPQENVSDIALFLSSAAPKGKLVELVARFRTVGC